MKQLRRGKDLNDKEFEEQLLAALQSEDDEALDVLLSDSTTAPLESTDTTKDQSSTINDDHLDTQELTYLSSDSNSETIMVILT